MGLDRDALTNGGRLSATLLETRIERLNALIAFAP
jgi:hypothetical protein